MKKIWDDAAWEAYLYWQTQDKKTLKRINMLIRDIERDPFDGIGKSEALRGSKYKGCWSRRIDSSNRLVYRIKNDTIEIISCKDHYDD